MKTQEKINNAIIWIDGLKGTTLKQGKHQLGDKEEGFCCLGYACHKLEVPFNFDDPYAIPLKDTIGLKGFNGVIEGGVIIDGFNRKTLAEVNDETDYSFRRISTLIKKRLDDIFIPSVARGLKKHYKR